ncbi:cytochrome P450 [Stachybotrys elegans]|uniref:Cytochrome P450 n=1 Tax=Stachybotrys elegans TaxID=80388 RepID=A0A8K0WL54_9HYPO|nr:cytochrome P450 [Stachybotrys elegans]
MLGPYLLAAAALLASYLYSRLQYARFKQYAHLPQPPTNLLLGHLKFMGEVTQNGIPDRHPDKVFEEMWISLGRPPVMFVDLRPVNPPMTLITNHEMAEQISKASKLYPLSTPKSPTWTHMIPILGKTTLTAREGSDWKDLRRAYNPGFAPQHIWSLLPLILERMEPFLNYLDGFANSGHEFSLETLLSNLTFDIIGAAVMEVDLNAQHMDRSNQGELIRLFAQLLHTYADDKFNLPWWIVPLSTWRRHQRARRIDFLVKEIIQQKYDGIKADDNHSRSILALSLKDTSALTPRLLSETSDQVRSFLFAGHDTSTSMLQWLFYELSRTPRALRAVRAELDEVLGPSTDPREICTLLRHKGESSVARMSYLNAAIKETLRLHPPASTVRMTPPNSGFTVRAPTGQDYCLDGTIMYSCQAILQRDPAVFGHDADVWVPERWLGDAAKKIPPSAWRPFERGPRNCIGMELANLEARVIIAIVARKYDFIKVGLGESILNEKGDPIENDKGQYKTKLELYNVRRMTAQPVDGTMMKVKIQSS